MSDRKYKIMDLFCGTGGFSKGFENAGPFEVIYGIDLLSTSVETFQLNHAGAIGVAGDIRKVPRPEIEELLRAERGSVDVIIGGPPCQGFSSIRPNRSTNYDDPRNTLFEEFAAYVGYWQPEVFVFENVVGLATHKNGDDLKAVIRAFSELGYNTDWRILNAGHFGVPQKRERLILIGTKSSAPIVWPSPTHQGSFRTIGIHDRGRMLRPETVDLLNQDVAPLPPAWTVMDAIGDLPKVASGESSIEYTEPVGNEYQAARRQGATELTLHESTRHSKKMLEIISYAGPNISYIPEHLITSGFSSCYSRLSADEPAPTITVNFVHPASNKCIHPYLDRALTPREGARLQSYDDTFKFSGKNRNIIAKQIGNAVPPLLGQAIGSAVLKMLTGRPTDVVVDGGGIPTK